MTTSSSTAPAATAAGTSSPERSSRRWAGPTTPSALSAAPAGEPLPAPWDGEGAVVGAPQQAPGFLGGNLWEAMGWSKLKSCLSAQLAACPHLQPGTEHTAPMSPLLLGHRKPFPIGDKVTFSGKDCVCQNCSHSLISTKPIKIHGPSRKLHRCYAMPTRRDHGSSCRPCSLGLAGLFMLPLKSFF